MLSQKKEKQNYQNSVKLVNLTIDHNGEKRYGKVKNKSVRGLNSFIAYIVTQFTFQPRT